MLESWKREEESEGFSTREMEEYGGLQSGRIKAPRKQKRAAAHPKNIVAVEVVKLFCSESHQNACIAHAVGKSSEDIISMRERKILLGILEDLIKDQ